MLDSIIRQACVKAYQWLEYFSINIKRLFCCLLIITSQPQLGYASALPVIHSENSIKISQQEEHRLGKLVAGNIRNKLPLWQDLAAVAFIKGLTQPLISRSQLNDKRIEIFIVDNPRINAFAAPGGVIGINTGLIESVESVDELVSVLAHEVAHLSLRHYARTQQRAQAQGPLYFGALIASIWLAGQVDANVGEAGVHATLSAMQRSKLSYSRLHEREADRVGFELMYQSPFDVSKMQTLLERLNTPSVTDSPKWQWARSHPITNERIADISQRTLITQKPVSKHGYELAFDILKVYQRASIANNDPLTKKALLKSIDPLSAHYSVVSMFAQALVNQANTHMEIAQAQLEKLSLANPNASLIWYQWMQNLLQQGKTQAVFEQLKLRKEYRAANNLSRWIQTQALRKNNENAASISSLIELLEEYPTWLLGWQTLADWSAKDQRLQLNHVAKARWHLLRAESDLALSQAHFASLQVADSLAGSVNGLKQRILNQIEDKAKFN